MSKTIENDDNQAFSKLKSSLPELSEIDFDDYNLESILKAEEDLDNNGQIGDYDDLDSIHRQIRAARVALYNVTVAQNENDRKMLTAELKHQRAWERIYLDTAGPDRVKQSYADVKTEKLYNELAEYKNISKSLMRKANFLRDELNTLQTLSNDYRQMLRVRQ